MRVEGLRDRDAVVVLLRHNGAGDDPEVADALPLGSPGRRIVVRIAAEELAPVLDVVAAPEALLGAKRGEVVREGLVEVEAAPLADLDVAAKRRLQVHRAAVFVEHVDERRVADRLLESLGLGWSYLRAGEVDLSVFGLGPLRDLLDLFGLARALLLAGAGHTRLYPRGGQS